MQGDGDEGCSSLRVIYTKLCEYLLTQVILPVAQIFVAGERTLLKFLRKFLTGDFEKEPIDSEINILVMSVIILTSGSRPVDSDSYCM